MTKGYVKDNIKESITVDYLKMAEKAILSYVQKQRFPEEINMLQEGASNVKKGQQYIRTGSSAGRWNPLSGWSPQKNISA